MKYISNETKLNRHRLAKVKSKQLTPNRRQRLVDHQERMRKLVQDFLSRDDNSRILPNKNDVKKNPDGIMQAKRTLTDYLESLHKSFVWRIRKSKSVGQPFADTAQHTF